MCIKSIRIISQLTAALFLLPICLDARNPDSALVPPGALLKGDLLNIHAPNSEGWRFIQSNNRNVEFGRRDEVNGDTYVALVSSFPIEGNPSDGEFISIVKAGIERDTSTKRFKNINATLKLITGRPYKCVSYESSAEDKGVKNSAANVPYFLHIRALYCQHPIRQDLGFMISYSQGGGSLNPSLDKDAESFFEGVQVPTGGPQ